MALYSDVVKGVSLVSYGRSSSSESEVDDPLTKNDFAVESSSDKDEFTGIAYLGKRLRDDVQSSAHKSDYEKSPYSKSAKASVENQEPKLCKKTLFSSDDDDDVIVISDGEQPIEEEDEQIADWCLRHSLGKLRIKQDECLFCGIDSSVKSQTKQLEQKVKINNHVKCWGKKREQVPADGHCILHAFVLGLKESQLNSQFTQTYSVQSLLPNIKDEILQNLDLYSPFLGDIDLVEELDKYLEYRCYNSDVVDLMLHVVANITSTSALVFYVNDADNNVHTQLINPPNASPQRTIFLSRVGQHYDAILDIETVNGLRKKGKYSAAQPGDIQIGKSTKFQAVDLHNRYSALSDSIEDENDDFEENNSTQDADEDEIMITSVKSNIACQGTRCKALKVNIDDEDSSSEASASDTSSDNSTHTSVPSVRVFAGKTYLSQSLWKDIPTIEATCLPNDIDGLKKYSLPFCPERRMESSEDGRKWQRYSSSKRKGFSGIRRLAQCKGSYRCDNTRCDFLKEYGRPNRHHFSERGNDVSCKHCDTPGLFVPCTARKIWEFDDGSKKVTILHYGNHSCNATKQRDKKTEKKIEESFKKNPKLKPGQLPVNCIVDAMIEGKEWQEVNDISISLLDEQRTKNIKKKTVRELNPYGHCFEALGILKEKTNRKDKFLIHKVNDRRMNGKPSFVFKTSAFKARLCISMDRNSDTVLSNEYCHFDGKVNRCPGFTTLTASVYHPTLRKMIKLAVMETEGESEEVVRTFWKELDVVIKEVGKDPALSFNPYGFMTDEAGGIWNAIKNHFPEEVVHNSVSCEFHFLQSVNRHTSHVSEDHKLRYKKLAKQLMDSATPPAYYETFNVLENFIDSLKGGQKNLVNWLQWWDARRIHWAKAFKCDLISPQSNLSEAVNASYTHRGSCHITLLRAAYEDTADSILVENQYEQYRNGAAVGGSGPSSASRAAREIAKQKRQAVRMSEELDLLSNESTFAGTEAVEASYKNCQIDPACSFEPTRKKVGRPKKKHVSVYDDTDSDSEQTTKSQQHNSKRAARTRTKPSKEFEKTLEKVINDNNKIKAENLKHNSSTNSFGITIKSKTTIVRGDKRKNSIWNTYECTIGTNPSCNCMYFVSNKGQVCKHIVWCLINLFGQNKNSNLLFQVALTANEIEHLKANVCTDIPANVRFTSEQQQSQPPTNQNLQKRQSSTNQQSKGPRPNVSEGVFEVWLLKLCDSRVNKCYGCGNSLKISGHIPNSPHDLVVVSNMRREYFVDGEKRAGKPGHVYFHLIDQCLRKRCPALTADRITISLHIIGQLTKPHKDHISKELGLKI